MPRNGSGVAEPVPGTSDAVPNTVIESAKYDALVADVYSIFNTAQPVSLGGTGGTDVLSAWDALAAQAVDIASATNINLDTATGPVINLTGTATVNSATLAVGHTRFVRATAASVLTASATFVINGSTSVNRTNAAGDLLLFIGGTGGTVRIWSVGSVSLASTTDVLTGTDASKAVTSDALYALWGKGIDVTAAATLTLGEGKLFNVVGNTTITDIDFAVPADGREATLIFEGAPLLTHNATTLNLPGAGDIQVVAGDRCDIVQDDADNIYISNYTKGGGLALYATKRFSSLLTNSGTTQTLNSIPSGYKHLLIQVLGVGNSSGANRILQIELSTDNGSTWGSAISVSGNVTGLRSGVIWCIGAGENFTEKIVSGLVSTVGSVAGQGQGFETVKVDVVDAIRLSWNTSSTFNSGYARIYRVA